MTAHFAARRYDEPFYHVIVRMPRTCANGVCAKNFHAYDYALLTARLRHFMPITDSIPRLLELRCFVGGWLKPVRDDTIFLPSMR